MRKAFITRKYLIITTYLIFSCNYEIWPPNFFFTGESMCYVHKSTFSKSHLLNYTLLNLEITPSIKFINK